MSSKSRFNQPSRKPFAASVQALFGVIMAITVDALMSSLNAKAIAQVSDISQDRDPNLIWVKALSFLFLLSGLGLLCYGIIVAKQAIKASKWPTVEGTIKSPSFHESSTEGGKTYEVVVEYDYSVEGKTYTGGRLAFGYGGSSNKQVHQAILDKLKGASLVTVRYNPQNHAISTLSCGINNSIKVIFASAFMWLSVGIAIFASILWMLVVAIVPGFLFVWLISQRYQVLLSNIEFR
jgi:hypothetical protein